MSNTILTPEFNRAIALVDAEIDASEGSYAKKSLGSKRLIAAGTTAALFLTITACGNDDNDSALPVPTTLDTVAVTAEPTEDDDATTATAEAVVDVTVEVEADASSAEVEINLSQEEIDYINGSLYGNIVTGNQASKEVGQIEISTQYPEVSKDNFYNDIRHNPQTLAFYAACLKGETPSYDNCAEDSDPEGLAVLNAASELLPVVWEMSPEEKGVLAEEVIAKFEAMEFKGVVVESGHYETMRLALDSNGNVVGFEQSTNNRNNDPRLQFVVTWPDGSKHEITIRSCAQITQEITTTPVIPETTIPVTTVPETTIPVTTVPETTIPVTTVPETTIPETTTTTEPEETTTTTTEPEETTTTTTEPEETTTTTTEPGRKVPTTTIAATENTSPPNTNIGDDYDNGTPPSTAAPDPTPDDIIIVDEVPEEDEQKGTEEPERDDEPQPTPTIAPPATTPQYREDDESDEDNNNDFVVVER